jgi:hypothetical protein
MPLPRHFPTNRKSRLSRAIRAVFDRGLTGWTLRIHIGPGAGYGWWVFNRRVFIPTGWTLWLGRNVRGGIRWGKRADMYRYRPWSLGITRNGNAAPYPTH